MLKKKRDIYIKANQLINELFKYTFIAWTFVTTTVGLYPFFKTFFDFLVGKYDESSWTIVYDTFWWVLALTDLLEISHEFLICINSGFRSTSGAL